MNFDINALKHHQLVEDGQLEGCYTNHSKKVIRNSAGKRLENKA
ncbi:hypothetical protein AB4407_16595 [Vibrio sp. 10N.261.46.E11]